MPEREQNYHKLREEVRALGLYTPTYGYYFSYACLITFGIILSLYIVTISDNLVVQLANAALLAFATVQAGMLGHDLAHNQVFASRDANRFFGVIVWGLYAGMSESDWYYIHNTHHEHPNQIDHDPDIDIPFVFSEKQIPEKPGLLLRTIIPHQHILFFLALPILYMTKLNATWKRTFLHFSRKHFWEVLLAAIHFVVLFSMLFAFLPWSAALAFLAVYAILVGLYMSFAFAPNHKGEEINEASEEITWVHQIVSTRNLFPSFFIFHFFGGLNYQIEHHLFPNLPRPNYPRVQKMVKEFCTENSIPYHETTWSGSMVEIYRSLKEQASKFSARKVAA